MRAAADVLSLIGDTPLIRLNAASAATGCDIYGKAEFLNAGQSIKDRTALGLIQAARESGGLRPGGTIVEGTAGNTGVGLAIVGAALDHPVVIVMPRSQTEEKKQAVRMHEALSVAGVSVFRAAIRLADGKHLRVACFLAIGTHPREGEPKDRVGPMQRLQHAGQPVHREIMACQMSQLVGQDETWFRIGESIRKPRWQQQRVTEDPGDRRTPHGGRNDDPWHLPQSHFTCRPMDGTQQRFIRCHRVPLDPTHALAIADHPHGQHDARAADPHDGEGIHGSSLRLVHRRSRCHFRIRDHRIGKRRRRYRGNRNCSR